MSTNFNLRLDEQLKAESFRVIEDFGLTPSQFMRLILKQVADTGSLPLSFEKRQHTLSKKGKRLVRESIEDIEQGRITEYASLDAFMQAAAHEEV